MNGTSSISRVAYFSMEVALSPAMPTYSGGLGILAGDTLRSRPTSGCLWLLSRCCTGRATSGSG